MQRKKKLFKARPGPMPSYVFEVRLEKRIASRGRRKTQTHVSLCGAVGHFDKLLFQDNGSEGQIFLARHTDKAPWNISRTRRRGPLVAIRRSVFCATGASRAMLNLDSQEDAFFYPPRPTSIRRGWLSKCGLFWLVFAASEVLHSRDILAIDDVREKFINLLGRKFWFV